MVLITEHHIFLLRGLRRSGRLYGRVFEQFAGYNLGLNFDPSHFIWQQMDYLAAIREFAPLRSL